LAERDYSGTPLTKKLGAKPGAHVVVYFTTSLADLERRFAKLKRTLAAADGLWIAYNKSVAFDDDWSAVRFVYRVENRP